MCVCGSACVCLFIWKPNHCLHVCIGVENDREWRRLLIVCVCPRSPCDCLSLSPAKQVVVSALFIFMWWPLSLCCYSRPVIVGRECNHVAVYHHYTTIEEDNVSHIWSFPPLTQHINISTGVRLPRGFDGNKCIFTRIDLKLLYPSGPPLLYFLAVCSVPFRNLQHILLD